MLDLFGSEYLIDHVVAEYNTRGEELMFRRYVGDLLKVIAESLGSQVNYRYADLINGTQEDTGSAEEIAADIIKRADLKGKG